MAIVPLWPITATVAQSATPDRIELTYALLNSKSLFPQADPLITLPGGSDIPNYQSVWLAVVKK
jgi:hypothetical protein